MIRQQIKKESYDWYNKLRQGKVRISTRIQSKNRGNTIIAEESQPNH